MLETELRVLFEGQASGDQPLTAITSQQVIRQGRSRLRNRRARAVAAPLLAAAAVGATVVATTLPAALPGKPRHHRSVPPAVAEAPKYFDPARIYPSFGWLPAGAQVTFSQTGTVRQTLSAQAQFDASQPVWLAWSLTVHSGRQCSAAGGMLRCNGGSGLSDVALTTRLPDINGLPAYWTVVPNGATLVFEYAGNAWAELAVYNSDGGPDWTGLTSKDQAETVQIAEHATFGVSNASQVFPVQLTGLPGWQLRNADMGALDQGTPGGVSLYFASGAAVDSPGPANNYPEVFVTATSASASCDSPAPASGQSTRSVIAGYPVTITRYPAGSSPYPPGDPSERNLATQMLCANDADGLQIMIHVRGNQPAIDVTQVFAHLRLLGPDPANWTTQPVG